MNDEWFTADSTHLLGPFVKETHDGGVGQRFRVLRQPPFSFFPHDIFMEIPVVLRDFQGQQDGSISIFLQQFLPSTLFRQWTGTWWDAGGTRGKTIYPPNCTTNRAAYPNLHRNRF